jgi:hypothetical protein
VFHHHEAHEVQAEVTCGRGRLYRHPEPGSRNRSQAGRLAVLLVLAHLAKGDPFAEIAAGFAVSIATAWR